MGQGKTRRMNDCKRGPHHRPTIRMNDFVFPVFDCCVLLYLQAFTTQNRKSFVSILNEQEDVSSHTIVQEPRGENKCIIVKNKNIEKKLFWLLLSSSRPWYQTKRIFVILIVILVIIRFVSFSTTKLFPNTFNPNH